MPSTNFDTRLPPELRVLKDEIEAHARAFGLDFFETIFEVVDADDLNEIALQSLGMRGKRSVLTHAGDGMFHPHHLHLFARHTGRLQSLINPIPGMGSAARRLIRDPLPRVDAALRPASLIRGPN